MSYSLEKRAQCRALYVESGLSFEQVNGETGVSLSQLKVWAKDGDWTANRDEFEREYLQMSGGLQKLKLKMLNEAISSGHPQQIFALSTLMRATPAPRAAQAGTDRATLFLEFVGKFIEYLKGIDSEALRQLEPHLRGFAEQMKQPEAA